MTDGKFSKFQMAFTRIVGKIAANKLLLTLRDTFILVAAVTMIAGFAIMISSVFLDPNGLIFGQQGLHLGKLISGSWDAWANSNFAETLVYIQSLINLFSQGALSVFSLLIVVVFSYTFSKKFFPKNKEHMTSVLYAMAAFFICLPWNYDYMVGTKNVEITGMLNSNFLGTQGVFSALLISGLAVWVYNKVLERNLVIKMPDSVPPAVARSFESLIPGIITLAVFVAGTGLSVGLAGVSLPELLLQILQKPAMAISGTAIFALVVQITWPLLQWFGIHPTSIWGPVFGVTWNVADTENIMGTAKHLYSTMFMNFSTIAAGTFALAPVIALLIFSKVNSDKKVAKIALMPAVFNISEPITFGLPIVLNPIMFVPFVIVQPICFYLAVFFTEIGFIDVITNNVPWTVPPLISGLLFTGTINGAIVQLVNLAVATVIYLPFIKIANQMNQKRLGDV